MPQEFPHLVVRVASLAQLFEGAGTFEMPWFQRSYAWSEGHADRLVVDIETAATEPRGRYFLGHIWLSGRGGDSAAKVIDGQQRLMTLTMLFALLRDAAPEGGDVAELDRLLWSQDEGTAAPKVLAQDCIREFLAHAVLESGATTRRIDPFRAALTDTERRILANRNCMAIRIAPMREEPERWQRFVRFLMERCYVVVETVEDEDEAWEMMTREEERRARHHSSEQAKATLIGLMRRDDQVEAGRIWDEVHARIGADGIDGLLAHLRTMLLTKRSMRPLVVELAEGYRLNTGGLAFMRDTFQPYATHYATVLEARVGTGPVGREIARTISMMQLLAHDLWVAPLLRWLHVSKGSPQETLAFVKALDRLALVLRLSGVDPSMREQRYIALTAEIRPGSSTSNLGKLAIEAKLLRDCEQNLRSRTFQYKRYAALVLKRLSRQLGDTQPALPDATIEHVLPRNPKPDSPWRTLYKSDKAIDAHAHRLGNLALLSFDDNQKAGNNPFPDKCSIYRASQYAIARDVATAQEWSTDAIMQRTELLIGLLMAE